MPHGKSYCLTVVVANPLQVRLIAEARVKTDKIDAAILAQLYASGFLPQVCIPNVATQAMQRQGSRRALVVRQRTRLKNEIHAVLAAHLIERCPRDGSARKKGRACLSAQPLPVDERMGIEQRLRELDRPGEDLMQIERVLAQSVIDDPWLRKLLTITGANTTGAVGLLSAIGDVTRFPCTEKMISNFGLNPCVYQTGAQPAKRVRISERGRSYARATLVDAAWAAAQSAGPLRAFFLRIRDRRGQQIAAVATASKIAVIVWYVLIRDEAFAWDRPALTARKTRSLELQAGMPAQRGSRKGSAAAYNLESVRDQERAVAEQAERAY